MNWRWREIHSVDAIELDEPLGPDEDALRIRTALSQVGLERVRTAVDARPDTMLWLENRTEGLEEVRHFPRLRRLSVDSLRLGRLDRLADLPDLVELHLGETLRPVSLQPLTGRSRLRRLSLRGTWRDVDVLSGLTGLRTLEIGSLDAALLVPLRELRSLTSGLGRIANLEVLSAVGHLEYVELYNVRQLHDVASLGEIPTLRHLSMSSTRGVTTLPSFANSRELRRLDLMAMRGLADLAPLAAAPALQILNLFDFKHAQPDILQSLVGHPTLRAGVWGFGSDRKNFAAQDLLPLPPEPAGYASARRREAERYEALPWDQPEWDGFRADR